MTNLRRSISVLLFALLLAGSVASAPAESRMCNLFGLGCPKVGAPAPFVPVFEQDVVIFNGFGRVDHVNPEYFATAETATKVCMLVQCLYVFSQTCDMGGGPAYCSVQQKMLAFQGFNMIAGLVAANWTRNPEKDFPGVAQRLAELAISARRAS